MGWYVRKGLSFGPLRINLSRGGVGWSVGGKGFRYGQNARGQSTISAGGGGIYYRKTLGGPTRTTPVSRPLDQPPMVSDPDPGPRPSPATTPLTTADLAALITEAQHRPQAAWYVVPATVLATVCAALSGGRWAALGFGLLGSIVAYAIIRRAGSHGTVRIDYAGLDAVEIDLFRDIQTAVRALDGAQGIWAAPLRVAGAASTAGVDRQDAEISSTEPPGVVTDIDTPNIVCDGWHACFLPQGLLIVADAQATLTPYRDIVVSGSEIQVAESDPAPDASTIRTTWRHTLPGGERDPAYANNPAVAVCRYGQITITTPQRILHIILSHIDLAKTGVSGLVAAIQAHRALQP